MFRECHAHHQEKQIVSIQLLVIVTPCWWQCLVLVGGKLWVITKNHCKMHGQQNVKFLNKVRFWLGRWPCAHLRQISPSKPPLYSTGQEATSLIDLYNTCLKILKCSTTFLLLIECLYLFFLNKYLLNKGCPARYRTRYFFNNFTIRSNN